MRVYSDFTASIGVCMYVRVPMFSVHVKLKIYAIRT